MIKETTGVGIDCDELAKDRLLVFLVYGDLAFEQLELLTHVLPVVVIFRLFHLPLNVHILALNIGKLFRKGFLLFSNIFLSRTILLGILQYLV